MKATDEGISFATEIRPLFRSKDVTAMKTFGRFDLSIHVDVSTHATDILERLEAGSMPCDGAWHQDRIDKFKMWIDGGKQP